MPKAKIGLKLELKVIKKEEIPHLLVPGEMGAVLELTVKDKNGKVTDHRVMRSKSFVRQFLELLWIEFNKVSKYTPLMMQDTGGLGRNIYENLINFTCDAGIGIVTNGIIVGTGTTAPTIDDYAIETLIDHDAAPPTGGRLQYGGVAFGAPASDATTSQFTITRDFANNSGGAITVNEIGLYVKGLDTDVQTRYFMTIRDVIGGGIAVPDGQTLTVNYREQAVV
ncbi:hypothetical protein ES707_13991 [subsurface metagenome]